MPTVKMGHRAPYEKADIPELRLKAKGEKITIRLIGDPYLRGKHYQQDEETKKWNISRCERVMYDVPCEICTQFFKVMAPAFKLKREAKKEERDLTGDEEKQIKDIKKAAMPYSPEIRYCYPVLDRSTHLLSVFLAPPSIRNQIDEEITLGRNVLEFDYVVTRTGKVPNYYTLNRLDSKETEPLTDDELAAIEEGKKIDIKNVVDRDYVSAEDRAEPEKPKEKKDKEADDEEKAAHAKEDEIEHEEIVDPDDIPF